MERIILLIQDRIKIDGELSLDGFDKGIELESFTFGVSNFIQRTTSNTGRTTGRPDFKEIEVVKKLDSTTVPLNFHCAKASHLGNISLHLVRQDSDGGRILTYMVYELEDTMISSVSVVGGGGSTPVETLSFNYSKITWSYTAPGGTITHSWSLATNMGT